MPFVRQRRYDVLRNFFNNDTVAMAFGNSLNFATGAPGDDGTVTGAVNESTVTDRTGRSTNGGDLSAIDSDGWLYLETNETWAAATGSAVFTHVIHGLNSTEGSTFGFYDTLPIPINISSGDVVRFAPYKLKWRFSDVVSNFIASGRIGSAFVGGSPTGVDTSMYLALSSTAPTRTGTNFTEPTGGYVRRFVDTDPTGEDFDITLGDTSTAINNVQFNFGTATSNWTNLTHWALWENSTGTPSTEFYFYGALDSTVTVLTGEAPVFLIGDFVISMSGS